MLFSHLVLSYNEASGGGLAVRMAGSRGDVTLVISNCLFFHGLGGGMFFNVAVRSQITIEDTSLVEEMYFNFNNANVSLSILNVTVVHSETHALYGVWIKGCCARILFKNTKMRFDNHYYGLFIDGSTLKNDKNTGITLQMVECQFEGSRNAQVVYLKQTHAVITNCTFSNNTGTGSQSAITIYQTDLHRTFITSSIISDNNMTGITLIDTGARFIGCNVIRNNRNTEGAGISLIHYADIEVDGELFLVNNTAETRGGAILLEQPLWPLQYERPLCSLNFVSNNSSVAFSGNRAGKGGSDIYNAILVNCIYNGKYIRHVGEPDKISWYFDTPLKKHFHFSNTDRLSSMSSDPIMVCFCNNSNLPDCSDRIPHHMQTYPGLEIKPSIATVGYYGGASIGDVLVSARRATVARYYGQSSSSCFQLHILLQNATSRTALVDIEVLTKYVESEQGAVTDKRGILSSLFEFL